MRRIVAELVVASELGVRRWWALGAVVLACVCVGIDSTVLSVALPTLARSLHASESDLQWFSSGYFLVLAAAMLPAGMIGDRFGQRRVFLASLALFAVGSAACAGSTSVAEFMAARVLLGLAGAGVIVIAVSSLTVLFTKEERLKAASIVAAGNFLSLPVGPLLGGWLLTNYSWGWVFLVNVPVALVAFAAAAAWLPAYRAPAARGVDVIGVALSVAGLATIVYGLIAAGQHGWSDPVTVGAIAGGVAILVGFLAWETRLTRRADGHPMLDVTLFASRSFTWGSILAAMSFFGVVGVLFTMPQYFQGALGKSAIGSGVRLLPLVAGMLLGAPPADQVVKRVGQKVAVATGFGVLAVGMAIGAQTSRSSGGAFVAGWMVVAGAGLGLALSTSTSAALVELSPERSGVGSGVVEAIDEVGGPFGTAIVGSVVSAGYVHHLHLSAVPGALVSSIRRSLFGGVAVAQKLHSPGLLGAVRSAFIHGMDSALLVSAAISALGAVLALLFLPNATVPAADGTEHTTSAWVSSTASRP